MPPRFLFLLFLSAALLFVLSQGWITRPVPLLYSAHANMAFPFSGEAAQKESSFPIPPGLLPRSITLKDHQITLKPFRLKGLCATLHLARREDGYLITLSQGSFSSIQYDEMGQYGERERKPYPLLEQVTFEGTFFWAFNGTSFKILDLAFHTPPQGVIRVEGTYGWANGTFEGSLQSSRLDLSDPLARLFSLPAESHLAFLLDTQVHVEQKAEGPLRWRGEGFVSGLEFHTPHFIHAGENLEARFHFSGWRDLTDGATQLELELRAKEGESLFDKLYFDLSQTPLHLFMDVSLPRRSPSTIRLKDLRFNLHSILEVHSRGMLHRKEGGIVSDLTVTAPRQPLKPLVHKFIGEPHGDKLPGLEQMVFDGDWAGTLAVQGPLEAPGLRGRIEIHGGSVISESGETHVKGIEVNLPFNLAPRDKDRDPITPPGAHGARGYIQVQEFQTPLLHLNSFELPFQSFPNGYRLLQSTTIPAEKGFIRILDLEMRDLPFAHRTGETTLRISHLGLDNFLRALFTEELAATLHGEKLKLRLRDNRLESSGPLHLDTFAGEVTVESFGMNQVVSPFRTYTLDVRWDDLNLEKLTGLTGFGRVTGHVRGHVRNLEMAGGMPVSFDLAIESLPRRQTRRTISVTAVENLTEISGGRSPFVGAGGIMASLFNTFPYEEMGIACYLENDFFTIRGTIVRDDQEYLVRRGWLGGINIINMHPDNRISWNDMLRRIQRIQRDSPQGTDF